METLSIIIPCFNEEKNLHKLFDELEKYIITQKLFNLEILFVNDGSLDKTLYTLEQFIKKYPHFMRVISYSKNKGKGFAIKSGLLEARGNWRLFLDADLAVSFDQIEKINPYLGSNKNIIIGSRALASSQVVIPQNTTRQFFGRVFTILANLATGLKMSDFTCGFKCFSSNAAQKIFSNTKINRWAYDAEALYLARKYNFDINEIGIVWKNGSDSKVKLVSDTLRSFFDLIRIRFVHRNIWK